MASGSIVSYQTGVDYIALTVRQKDARKRFQRVAMALLEEERLSGFETRPWSFHGYQGFRCGSVEYGTRYEDDLARISGSKADSCYMALAGFADTAPRIDVQVTVWDGIPVLPRLQGTYAGAALRTNGVRARPVFDLRQTTLGGSTLYVGRRQSLIFGRVYDTFAKHKAEAYQGSIRFELQAANCRAAQILALAQSLQPNSPVLANFVMAWFRKRFASLESASSYLSAVGGADFSASSPVLCNLPRRAGSCESRLEFARKQWRKTAQLLVTAGYGDELLKCLGLKISAGGALDVIG